MGVQFVVKLEPTHSTGNMKVSILTHLLNDRRDTITCYTHTYLYAAIGRYRYLPTWISPNFPDLHMKYTFSGMPFQNLKDFFTVYHIYFSWFHVSLSWSNENSWEGRDQTKGRGLGYLWAEGSVGPSQAWQRVMDSHTAARMDVAYIPGKTIVP